MTELQKLQKENTKLQKEVEKLKQSNYETNLLANGFIEMANGSGNFGNGAVVSIIRAMQSRLRY